MYFYYEFSDSVFLPIWHRISADKMHQAVRHTPRPRHGPHQPAEAGTTGVGRQSDCCHAHCRRQGAEVHSVRDQWLCGKAIYMYFTRIKS